jgi:proteic killer suppression protein
MIVGFKSDDTQRIFEGLTSRRYPAEIQVSALRKLLMLQAAISINDLRTPPGNGLEKLSGDRDGQYSIRINSHWRICFVWTEGHNADKVEIVDYH